MGTGFRKVLKAPKPAGNLRIKQVNKCCWQDVGLSNEVFRIEIGGHLAEGICFGNGRCNAQNYISQRAGNAGENNPLRGGD